jgi:hypothetical protein
MEGDAMSHVTTVKLKMRELADVKAAAEACGLELKEGQTTFRNYIGHGRCEHALALPNPKRGEYEIGLVKAADGYEAHWDTWGQDRLIKAVGPAMGKLRQEYAAAHAMRKARAQLAREGFVPAGRVALPDGRLELRLRRR